jgi:uncharacterized membrane protein YhaH (DUF805 family)
MRRETIFMTYSSGNSSVEFTFIIMMVICVAAFLITIAATWKMFKKAGVAGWKCLIPYYNNYLLFKIATGNGWLFLLLLVPFVNFVAIIWMEYKLCEAFNKTIALFIIMLFLPIVGFCIIGFDDEKYIGPQKR